MLLPPSCHTVRCWATHERRPHFVAVFVLGSTLNPRVSLRLSSLCAAGRGTGRGTNTWLRSGANFIGTHKSMALLMEEDGAAASIILKPRPSVPDADPPDPHVFGPPGSISQRYGSGSGSFYQQAKIAKKTLIPTVL